jgi:2-keto-4-pentenoate hydratase
MRFLPVMDAIQEERRERSAIGQPSCRAGDAACGAATTSGATFGAPTVTSPERDAAGGAVMGDPAAAVALLANTLAARGEHLPAGSTVLLGGLTASVALTPGANVVVEFNGLGSVEVHS